MKTFRSPWPCGSLGLLLITVAAACGAERKSFSTVQGVVQRHFQGKPDFQPQDIISRSDVEPLFEQLAKLGWDVADGREIVQRVPEDSDFLVVTLRSRAGQRFMRQVSSDKLIYDRLDRIAREEGGQPLIQSLVQLPDGHRYALDKRPRAVPGLTDFLPKNRSGKTRSVADYSKPTGRIYTVDDLLRQLQQSYSQASRPTAR